MQNRDNLLRVFQTIYQWRKAIRNICLLTLVGSIALSLTLKNYYEAVTIFYPASPQLANPELMFGYTGQVTEYFGSDRDLDRISEIANSNELVDYMVTTFNLYAHYGIDSTDQKGPYEVRKLFRYLYSAEKNKNDAIELRVEDTDPEMAAKLANAARNRINEVARRLTKESQGNILIAFEDNMSRKRTDLAALGDSIRRMQSLYGIYHPEAQGEQLTERLAEAETEVVKNRARLEILEPDRSIPRDTIAYIRANLSAYERQLRQMNTGKAGDGALTVAGYNEGMPRVSLLNDLHFQARKQLSYDLERYNQIKAAYNTNIPAVLIIEEAEKPLIKNRPKRSVIVLACVLGAFLFSVLGALVADAYRDIDWKSITRKEAA